MSGVRIVTDSACDLTDQELADHQIPMVPLSIRFGSEEFTDRIQLSVEDFYAKMAVSDKLPETAAPSPGQFVETFQGLLDDGADSVVCINLSGALSATIQAAETAVQSLEGSPDIRVFDSRTLTAGLGAMVLAASRAAADGADAHTVMAMLEDMRHRTHVYGVLNTLDNLKKGGRIGGAAHLLGSVLSVKPALDLSSGEVEEAGKPRTRKKALAWLRDRVAAEGKIEQLAIMHGMADDVDQLVALVEPLAEVVRIGPIGAVVGTHGGPAVIGVAFLDVP